MANILIDGYNLIGTSHDDLEKARNEIINRLQDYAAIKHHAVTVVFDGWKSGLKEQTRTSSRHVTVIYTRIGEKADDVMKRMIRTATKKWIVVSSDREISDYAVKRGFAAVSSTEFEEKLFLALNRIKGGPFDDVMTAEDELMEYYEDELDRPPPHSGGNPRKLSRRKKIKTEALKKL